MEDLKYYNCNYDIGDFVICIDPTKRSCYLTIFRIVTFVTHTDLGRVFVDRVILEFNSKEYGKHVNCSVETLLSNFRRICIENPQD